MRARRIGIALIAMLFMLVSAGAARAATAVDNGDSFALILVNKDYKRAPVIPHAERDGAAIKRVLLAQGFDPTRIKVLTNEPSASWAEWLGTDANPRGKLWREMRAVEGHGNVFVYFVGHGLPAPIKGQAGVRSHLLPTEVAPELAADFAPALDTIERNLEEVKALLPADRWLIFMVEACFSGRTAAGAITPPGMMAIARPTLDTRPSSIIRISAAAADETAWWDDRTQSGLLTRQFVAALEGRGGPVSGQELRRALRANVTKAAQTLRGVDQTPQIDRAIDDIQFLALRPDTKAAPVNPVDANRRRTLDVARATCERLVPLADDNRFSAGPTASEIKTLKSSAREAIKACSIVTSDPASVAAGKGRPELLLGWALYADGQHATARRWFQKSADAGHPLGMTNLAEMARDGEGGERDLAMARLWFGRAAEAGHAGAMDNYGLRLYFGEGGDKDHVGARLWFLRSAEAGLALGMTHYAEMLRDGEGGEQDLPNARVWFEKAAGEGVASAMLSLGNLLYSGRGTPKDYTAARSWYQRSADAGSAVGKNNYAEMLRDGEGGPANLTEARRLFLAAATDNSPHAMTNLALMLRAGTGGAREPRAAAEWLEKAVAINHVPAHYELAVVLDEDPPPLQNRARAGQLIATAIARGHRFSLERVEAGLKDWHLDTRRAFQGELKRLKVYDGVVDGDISEATISAAQTLFERDMKR